MGFTGEVKLVYLTLSGNCFYPLCLLLDLSKDQKFRSADDKTSECADEGAEVWADIPPYLLIIFGGESHFYTQ